MANGVFNHAKGRVVQLLTDHPNSIQVLLLKVAEADGTLNNYDDVTALLAAAGNTEADFTNYTRKTGITESLTEDDTNDWVDCDFADQTWTAAGGVTNNTLAKAIVCVQTGANDTSLIPLTHHDWTPTTDGSDLILQVASSGFFRAS